MNRKTDYAIRAATYLAHTHSQQRAVTTAEISRYSGAPRKYLARILLALKKQALISSTAGRSGGYRLIRRPELISLAEIMDAVAAEKTGSACDKKQENPCMAASVVVEELIKETVRDAMSKFSLAKLAALTIEDTQPSDFTQESYEN